MSDSPFATAISSSALESQKFTAGSSADAIQSYVPELIRYLPRDFPQAAPENVSCPPSAQTSDEAAAKYSLDALQTERVRLSAAALGTDPKHFLLTGFAALITRLACQERIVIAAAVQTGNQQDDGSEPSAAPAYKEGLAEFQFDRECSFADAIRLAATRETIPPGAFSAAEIGFQYPAADLRGTRPSQADANAGSRRQFALCLKVRETPTGLDLRLTSTTGLWSTQTLGRWLQYLGTLLEAAAAEPSTPVVQLALAGEASTQAFHQALNQTIAEYPRDLCVHQWIAQQCARSPDAIAIRAETGHQACTYRELDRRSTALANHLVTHGAAPGQSVAVCMQRSLNLPVALLAILKSGACYVPLDPQHPPARLTSVIEECEPAAIISDAATISSLHGAGIGNSCPLISADDFFRSQPATETTPAIPYTAAQPEDAAYTIYTSGSTGKPKGVVIRHRALMNLLWAMRNQPGMHNQDRLLAITTISFDIATMDMFLPLCVGGTLVVAAEESAADPIRLARLIDEEGITILQATPVTWRMLTASGWRGRPGLKMISGGEALARDLANQLLEPGGELWNCYGPTETTIYSSVIRVTAGDGIVPLGPPIANTSFFVVDDAGRLLPPGIAGELYIGGDGVSPGYLQRPELNTERFLLHPFPTSGLPNGPSKYVFRTGDLVRILPGNQLQFFGRLDHQVKLRGYRIELGEIEWVLRTHPAVADAAVLLEEDIPGEPELVAYVTPDPPSKTSQTSGLADEATYTGTGFRELRQHASLSLPQYMLPARIHLLESMPLTGSGKIDRKQLHLTAKLPQQDDSGRAAPASISPANALEAKLLGIFRQVLREPALGVTDSFFEYGGYSMLSVRLFNLINKRLGRRLPISLLFEAPTVRSLALRIASRETLSHIVPIRPAGNRAPLFFIHSYLLYRLMDEVIDRDRPLYGLRELPESAIYRTVADRAEAYAREIAAASPEFPIHLAGWCAAGPLTVEVARQLREMGYQVGLVSLFDSELPGYVPRISSGRSLLLTKIATTWKFHRNRLGDISWSQRAAYIFNAIQRRTNELAERLEEKSASSMEGLQLWRHQHFRGGLAAPLRDVVLNARNEPPKPYPGEITLYRAIDVPTIPQKDQSLGWSQIARDGVTVEFVDGNHESMFLPPNIAGFAARLGQAMDEAEDKLPARPSRVGWQVHSGRFAG